MTRDGLDPQRVQFINRVSSREYFDLYHGIDVGLDPFPCAGGTTTCDALWMGVPVVTLAGRTAVGRAGVSLLSNVGLPELIAQTEDQYIRIASDLAANLPYLAQVRKGLRERMQKSPLADGPRFARHMDDALRSLWQRWCAVL
jgi:predicted O-linked N-acetylglucosamine transferase (SPINDLY family)